MSKHEKLTIFLPHAEEDAFDKSSIAWEQARRDLLPVIERARGRKGVNRR